MNASTPFIKDESLKITRKPLYTVHIARADEVDEIIRLFIENLWHIAPIPPDAPKVAREICQSIAAGRMLVLEREGEIVGAASYVITSFWYSTEEFLFDTGAFVIPKYRKTRAGFVLWEAMKKEARDQGKRFLIGAGTTDATVAPIWAKRYPQITIGFLVDPNV